MPKVISSPLAQRLFSQSLLGYLPVKKVKSLYTLWIYFTKAQVPVVYWPKGIKMTSMSFDLIFQHNG